MKYIYTLFIILSFTISTFAQSNSSEFFKRGKSKTNYFYLNKVTPPTFEKLTYKSYEIKDLSYKSFEENNFQGNYGFKVIPIPPATSLNNKLEMLPLYKPEDFAIIFLNHPIKQSNIISNR